MFSWNFVQSVTKFYLKKLQESCELLWFIHLFLRVCGAGRLGSNFLLFPSSLNWVLALLVEINFDSFCHRREKDFWKSNTEQVLVLKTPPHLKHRVSILILKSVSEAIRQRYEDAVLMDLQENSYFWIWGWKYQKHICVITDTYIYFFWQKIQKIMWGNIYSATRFSFPQKSRSITGIGWIGQFIEIDIYSNKLKYQLAMNWIISWETGPTARI